MTVSKARAAAIAARRARVVEMRLEGRTYAQIAADELVNLPSAAHAAVDASRALEAAKKQLEATSALFVATEIARIDAWTATTSDVLAAARDEGDHLMALRAVDRLTRLSERRSKILGLEASLRRPAPKAEEPPKAPDSFDALAAARRRRRGAG